MSDKKYDKQKRLLFDLGDKSGYSSVERKEQMTEATKTPPAKASPPKLPAPDAGKAKRKRDRSPNYPGLSLKHAVALAKILYDKEGKQKAPLPVAFAHWSYSPKSSSAGVAVAALKKFGLTEEAGKGKAREIGISQLGLTIILHEPTDKERTEALQKAAMRPSVHQMIWQEFGEGTKWGTDESLKTKLILKKNFTEAGALDFINKYKETLEFANLAGGGNISFDASDKSTDEDEEEEDNQEDTSALGTVQEKAMPAVEAPPAPASTPAAHTPNSAQQTRDIQVPLTNGAWAIVRANFPMSEESWQQMLAVLSAMKPGLVK